MGTLLPAMKYETYTEYDPHHTALAERAFLTLWSALSAWHSDLVLVGGLVPKYLCHDPIQQSSLPHPATLDVDLGIALAADSGQYGNLRWALDVQGFKASVKHPNRLQKNIGAYPAYLDFLVEHTSRTSGASEPAGTAGADAKTASINDTGLSALLTGAPAPEARCF
jgi:hypothetical protein